MIESNEVKYNFNRNFVLITTGRLISDLGSSIFGFVVSLYVLDLTGSAGIFSLILSLSMLPAVFVNMFAGVIIDRLNRKKLIVYADLLTGFVVGLFVLVFRVYPDSILLIGLCNVVISTIQSFFGLALNASIPNMVEESQVARVNSIFQALGPLIRILGPILGAIVYKALALEIIFIINGISFIVSGVFESLLQFRTTRKSKIEKNSYVQDIKMAFSYLKTENVLFFLLLFAVIANFIFYPLIILVIPYINYNVIKISQIQLSFIEASCAVGMIIGALIVGLKNSSIIFLKKFFVLLQAQALLVILWIFPSIPFFNTTTKWLITLLYCLVLLVIGILNTLQNIPIITYFQLKIPEELRGRVLGVGTTMLMISMPLGIWFYGFMLEYVQWTVIPIFSGISLFLLCLYSSRNKAFVAFIKNLE